MRGRALAGAFVLVTVLPVVGSPPLACANEGARAVLVVDTGADELRYCVSLPDAAVSGIELVELAAEQHGLQYSLGFGGKAVCQLAGIGPEGDDCFADYPDFWGYWRGDGSGGWSWSSSGAASTRVGDGDLDAWSWGSGQDGASHPSPPATEFDSICAPLAGAPHDDSGGSGQMAPAARDRAGSGYAAPEEQAEDAPAPAITVEDRVRPRPSTRRRSPPATRLAAGSDESEVQLGPGAARGSGFFSRAGKSDGPPATGLAALAGAALVGGIALGIARRRRTDRVGR